MIHIGFGGKVEAGESIEEGARRELLVHETMDTWSLFFN